MEVRKGMSDVVVTVGPTHSLRDAARMMADKNTGAALVYQDERPGPGIITERDLMVSIGRGDDPDSEQVGDHCAESVVTAAPSWSLERAALEMSHRNIRHIVIVDGGDVVGVLSMRDIVRVWTSDYATSGIVPPEAESAV